MRMCAKVSNPFRYWQPVVKVRAWRWRSVGERASPWTYACPSEKVPQFRLPRISFLTKSHKGCRTGLCPTNRLLELLLPASCVFKLPLRKACRQTAAPVSVCPADLIVLTQMKHAVVLGISSPVRIPFGRPARSSFGESLTPLFTIILTQKGIFI
jgi:hypothetical protein